MNIFTLAIKEISFFRKNFVYSVAVTALLTATSIILTHIAAYISADSKKTIDAKLLSTETMMNTMEKQYRTISERMGYTLSIISSQQQITEFYADNFSKEYIPGELLDSIQTLVGSGVRCILPVFQFKTSWNNREILVKGSGNISASDGSFTNCASSVALPVKGRTWLGYELHLQNSLLKGNVAYLDKSLFSIDSCMEQSGSIDDITMWINIEDAWAITGKKGVLSEILIWIDVESLVNLPSLKSRILQKAGNCTILERTNSITLQINANTAALNNSREAILREIKLSAAEKKTRIRMLTLISAVSALIVFTWISFLILQNTTARRQEIFTLKAIGYSRMQIFSIFSIRIFFLAITGIITGSTLGYLLLALFKIRFTLLPILLPGDILVALFIFSGIIISFTVSMTVNKTINTTDLSAAEGSH